LFNIKIPILFLFFFLFRKVLTVFTFDLLHPTTSQKNNINNVYELVPWEFDKTIKHQNHSNIPAYVFLSMLFSKLPKKLEHLIQGVL